MIRKWHSGRFLPIKAWKEFQDEEEPHTHGTIYFSISIFVGVAYNVGHLLEHSGPSLTGFIQCMMLFAIASKAWQDKVLFFSRFDVDDILHKALNVVEYCIVGVMACHITGFSLHNGESRQRMRGFTVLMLVHRVFVGFRWLEISYNATRVEAMNLEPTSFAKVYIYYHSMPSRCTLPLRQTLSKNCPFSLFFHCRFRSFYSYKQNYAWTLYKKKNGSTSYIILNPSHWRVHYVDGR